MTRSIRGGEMRFKNLLILAIICMGAAPMLALARLPAGQTKFPPLGKRDYIVDQERPFAPVAIQPKGESPGAKRFLRDPVSPNDRDVAVEPGRPVPKAPRPVVAKEKAGQLRFGALTIPGHRSRPRVEFNQEILPRRRADEPLAQDFFPKIFLPVQDSTF